MSIINNTIKGEFHPFLALKPVSYSESSPMVIQAMIYPSNIGLKSTAQYLHFVTCYLKSSPYLQPVFPNSEFSCFSLLSGCLYSCSSLDLNQTLLDE